jgi:D-serine deaminase-like pyridoxal phosphate-dependent protein
MDPTYVVKNASTIPSPALLVYLEKFNENTASAIAIAGDVSRLRPHIKTHKTKQIVALQQKAGIEKFKCATIAEAEMLAQCGVKDIFLAYPMVGPNIIRFIELCKMYPEVSFKVIADDLRMTKVLSERALEAHLTIEVLLDLDVGMHRTGIVAEEKAIALYQEIDRLDGVIPGGLHGYDGHNHLADPDERCAAAKDCLDLVNQLKDELERRALPVPRLVMGGTPTFPCYARFPHIELSPGTCFFHDWSYQQRYQDMPFQAAALLLSRIISLPGPGLITLDLGSKAIATDQPGERGGILNVKGATPILQSEEHWVFEVSHPHDLQIGDELYIMPTHICPTFALHQEVYVIGPSGEWEETWPVAARNRTLTI